MRPRFLGALGARRWAHFTALPLACVELSNGWAETAIATGRGVVVSAAVLGFGYALNAMSDRHVDRDLQKNAYVGNGAPPRSHVAGVSVLALLALAVAATGPLSVPFAAAVAITCGTIYSVGPRLKARPYVGTLLNVGCFAPLLLTGAVRPWPTSGQLLLVLVFASLLVQNQLLHEGADASDDRAAGVRTTFLAAGPWGAAGWSLLAGLAVFGALAVAGAWATRWWVALAGLPFVAYFPYRTAVDGPRPEVMATLRRAHRWLAALVGAGLFLGIAAS